MSQRFDVTETIISGLRVVQRQKKGDERGFLARLFCREELQAVGWTKPIAQINHTYSATKGTVRGMHFQYPPKAEMKLVMCIRGAILDIGLDLRDGSKTFLASHAEELSEQNCRALLIPEGCAHGFQALTDDVEILYLHSEFYDATAEGGLSPLDPKLAISWPLGISVISERDRNHASITDSFKGLKL